MDLQDKEQYLNLISYLKLSLEMYGNKENWKPIYAKDGKMVSPVELDQGENARYALKRAEDFLKQHEEMDMNYGELLKQYGISDEDAAKSAIDFEEMFKDFKEKLEDDKDV